ncbi:MAG: metallophosphoesterase family protein [Myxococcales bacterium]|nr:metallophosphoesterase family protein [Myxococcales bacterium]
MHLTHQVEQLEGVHRRVGCIGDVHCEDRLLERVLRQFASADLDLVVCVGDLMDGFGDPNRTIQLLRAHDVRTVRGNHDRWFLTGAERDLAVTTPADSVDESSRNYLEALPVSLDFETPRGRVKLCHGLGNDDLLSVKPDDSGFALSTNDGLISLLEGPWRWVINGHTHQVMLRQFGLHHSVVGSEPIDVPGVEASLGIVNAGTLLRGYPQGFVIVDFSLPTGDPGQSRERSPPAGHLEHWSLPPGPDGYWPEDGSAGEPTSIAVLSLE